MIPVVSGLRPAKIGMNHLGLLGSTKNHPLFFPIFGGLANGKHAHPKKTSSSNQRKFRNTYHDGLVLDLCMTEGGVTYFKHGGWNDSVQPGHSTKPADRLPLGMVVSRGRLSPFMTASFKLVNYYIYSNLIFPDRCFSNINNDI